MSLLPLGAAPQPEGFLGEKDLFAPLTAAQSEDSLSLYCQAGVAWSVSDCVVSVIAISSL